MTAARTIHGWPVCQSPSDPLLVLFRIPGVPSRSLRLRKDVGPYLVAFASEYHKIIAPLDKGVFDDWSWSPVRTGRASSSISDHCAGVAIDLNATKEGSQGAGSLTFWRNPINSFKLRKLRKKYHLLEWGGDYQRFRDPMHWTFKYGVDPREIKNEMKRLGINSKGLIAT